MKPNLSSLSDNEINSGKIWTLLRHNKQFEEDVIWFSSKYKRSKSKRTKQENREKAISDFHQKYEEINKDNPFAGTALQWMFPMPIFINDDSGEANDHPFSWGPIFYPKKGDKVDVLAEWKEYEAGENQLTLKTDWLSANEGFKRVFNFQYRQFDSRPVNPITKNRSDSPFPHETDFFDNLDLFRLIEQGPDLTEEGLGKVFHANDLRQNYRTFVVPRHLHTKKAVDEAFSTLIKAVKDSLPTKASALFGTNAEWKDFMQLKKIQAEGKCSKKDAIVAMTKLRSSVYLAAESRRTYETRIKKNINAIEGKIFRCYPNFHFQPFL
jgi:hypothetical protein